MNEGRKEKRSSEKTRWGPDGIGPWAVGQTLAFALSEMGATAEFGAEEECDLTDVLLKLKRKCLDSWAWVSQRFRPLCFLENTASSMRGEGMAAHCFRQTAGQGPVLEPRGISPSVSEHKLPGKFSDWLCLDQSQCPDVRNIVIGWSVSHGCPTLRRCSSLAAPPGLQAIGVQGKERKVVTSHRKVERRAEVADKNNGPSLNCSFQGEPRVPPWWTSDPGGSAEPSESTHSSPFASPIDHIPHFSNIASLRRLDAVVMPTTQI